MQLPGIVREDALSLDKYCLLSSFVQATIVGFRNLLQKFVVVEPFV